MPESKPVSRRRFLLLGGGVALSALLGAAYINSGCPLSNSGVCVGPCAALQDRDSDGVCDRLGRGATSSAVERTEDPPTPQPLDGQRVACPFGLVNDPFPGQCGRYIDRDRDGICDLSIPGSGADAPVAGESTPEDGGHGPGHGFGHGGGH
jgi:hypothetical protein